MRKEYPKDSGIAPMAELTQRARRVLFAVVTEFISTGDPVGSRTLARKYGLDLSPASIRNVLADLEEMGFLQQPHTSAGRIPTDRALRLFIDTLVDVRAVAPETMVRMGQRFAEIYATADDPLRETGRFLSELSGQAAIVAASRGESRTLQQLRFIQTRPNQLLAVLVFSDGAVENRYVQLEQGVDDRELERVHNLLADVIEGRSLGEIRDLFARRLADERLAVDALRRRAFELGSQALSDAGAKSEVHIEGQARLLEMPEYGDVSRLKKLMRALEDRADLVELLDKTMAADTVSVYVGREAGDLADGEISIVVAPYKSHGRTAGAVGVLGPTRMDYAKVMPLVDATASALSDAMGRRDDD